MWGCSYNCDMIKYCSIAHHNTGRFITSNNWPNSWILRKLRLDGPIPLAGTGWCCRIIVTVEEYSFSTTCWSLVWTLTNDGPYVGVGVIRSVQGIMMLFLPHGSAWCYSSLVGALVSYSSPVRGELDLPSAMVQIGTQLIGQNNDGRHKTPS